MSLIARRRSIVSGAAGGFVPTDISGCILWLDASDASTITSDVNGVSNWADKSTTGANFSQSNNSYKPDQSSLIYSNAILTDGTQSLGTTGTISTASEYTIFFVTYITVEPVAAFILDCNSSGTRFVCDSSRVGNWNFYFGAHQIIGLTSINTKHVSEWYLEEPNNMILKVNGSQVGTSYNYTATAIDNATALFGRYLNDGVNGMIGHTAEIIIYNSVLTGDAVTVRNYLNNKWSIY